MPNRRLNVFLCHAKEDKPTVRELYRQLTAEGWMDVWLDEENLFPGQEWDMEIEKAVEAADVVVVCLSSHSVDKEGYVQKELRFVLNIADEKPEGTIFVVPVRLDECQVPRRIRAWQYVDYFPKGRRKIAYQRLLESLKLRARKLGIPVGRTLAPHASAGVANPTYEPVDDKTVKAERERKANEERERVAAQKIESERIAREKAESDRVVKAERDRLARQKAEERRKALLETFRSIIFKRVIAISGIGLALFALFFVGKFVIENLPSIPTLQSSQTPEITKTLDVSATPPAFTVEPSKTIFPTSLLSTYLLTDEATTELYPPMPVTGDAAWLIDETAPSVQFDPSLEIAPWQEGLSFDPDAGGEVFIYTSTGNVSVTWAMDAPFDTTGYYEIFIVDPQEQSKGAQQFQISINGQPAQPYRGTSHVIFQGVYERSVDAWISLGVYQANAGETMSVGVALGQLSLDMPFAVDRLLIVRLNESTMQMLDRLPARRTLVSLMDDTQASFFEISQEGPVKVNDRGNSFSNVQAWNGGFLSRTFTIPFGRQIWIDWLRGDRIEMGTYEAYVWIPAKHATVIADYAFLADGQIVERDRPARVNQADHAGVWWTLGTWTLDKEATVGLRMIVASDALGEIGVDAVAIVRVEQ